MIEYGDEQDYRERLKTLHDPIAPENHALGHDLTKHKIQEQRKEVHCSIYTVDLGTIAGGFGVLFPGGLHLGEGCEIGGMTIEHPGATANIVVTEGSGGSGRTIGVVKPGFLRTMALPDYISNVSLRTSVADTGLVIVTLHTHVWAPGLSKLS